MTTRVYGDPRPFHGGAKVNGCFRDELGFLKVMVGVNTPDGLHHLTLSEHEWAMLYHEVKERFTDGADEEDVAEAA